MLESSLISISFGLQEKVNEMRQETESLQQQITDERKRALPFAEEQRSVQATIREKEREIQHISVSRICKHLPERPIHNLSHTCHNLGSRTRNQCNCQKLAKPYRGV